MKVGLGSSSSSSITGGVVMGNFVVGSSGAGDGSKSSTSAAFAG